METIRQRLTKRARLSWGSILAVFVLLLANAHFGLNSKLLTYVVMSAGALVIVYMGIALKCPRCGHNLSQIGMGFGGSSDKDRMNVCPGCGVRLDDPV